MKSILTIVFLLSYATTVFSQSTNWFLDNYPIDYTSIRKDNHNFIKGKVIGIDKKTIKPDYLIKIEVDTVYSGKVDSSILLINVAMPYGVGKEPFKNSQKFINSLEGKYILLNMWKIDLLKNIDNYRESKYWTSAYPIFVNGLINVSSYINNRYMAIFPDSPSLFIADIANFYNIEEITTAFYKAMKSENCELLLKFIQDYERQMNFHRFQYLFSATSTYISNCKCE